MHLVNNDNNRTMRFCIVKISRLQANPQKQQNYFTSKIIRYLGHSLLAGYAKATIIGD